MTMKVNLDTFETHSALTVEDGTWTGVYIAFASPARQSRRQAVLELAARGYVMATSWQVQDETRCTARIRQAH